MLGLLVRMLQSGALISLASSGCVYVYPNRLAPYAQYAAAVPQQLSSLDRGALTACVLLASALKLTMTLTLALALASAKGEQA